MAEDKNARAKEIEDAIKKGTRKDSTIEGAPLDKILAGLEGLHEKIDDICERVDALEGALEAKGKKTEETEEGRDPGEPEPVAADSKTRRDAERKEMDKLVDAHVACDSVASQFGASAPRFMNGETLAAYRVRLLRPYQTYSTEFKDVDLYALSKDPTTFAGVEKRIYADAAARAKNPEVAPMRLVQRTRRDDAGHTIHSFHGDPLSWMAQFGSGATRAVTKISIDKANL